MKAKWKLAILVICSLLIGATGGHVGSDLFLKWNAPKEDVEEHRSTNQEQVDLVKVAQAYELIRKHYIEEVDDEKLISGAIQGMVETLKDPYSVYMDEETAKQFSQSLDSSFEGIGTEIGVEDEKIIIVSPYKDSPAEKAGLKPKDEIVSVDGNSVKGLNVQEVSVKIRGEKGTKVKLEIKRPGVANLLTFDIKRDQIPVETVFSSIKEEAGKKIGYIEITSFSKQTSTDFAKELKALEKKEMEGLIIDVRGNPGGLLPSVEEIVSEVVTNEKPYLQIESREGEQTKYYTKLEEQKPYDIVVLIDEGSASASEILAASLQEAGGYALIGEKTFGKGTVQQAVQMNDGSNIKLTLYKWLTPNGNWIHKKGIEPTVSVKQPSIFHTQPLNIETILKRDMTNEQVEHAQEMLRGLGYETGRNDGYFDLKTEVAVKAFQNSEDLEITGKIDVKTAAALEKNVIEEIKNEDNDLQLRTALRYLTK